MEYKKWTCIVALWGSYGGCFKNEKKIFLERVGERVGEGLRERESESQVGSTPSIETDVGPIPRP